MNWKLLFTLSLFGLAMAITTISLVPTKIEPIFWLIIFIACSWIIAKNTNGKYFLHGFVLSLINSVYIVTAHVLFFSSYMANHTEMSQMNANMPMSHHPRILMIILGPIFGAAFGLVQGLFSFLASKIVKK